jgi:hypothetical protein
MDAVTGYAHAVKLMYNINDEQCGHLHARCRYPVIRPERNPLPEDEDDVLKSAARPDNPTALARGKLAERSDEVPSVSQQLRIFPEVDLAVRASGEQSIRIRHRTE